MSVFTLPFVTFLDGTPCVDHEIQMPNENIFFICHNYKIYRHTLFNLVIRRLQPNKLQFQILHTVLTNQEFSHYIITSPNTTICDVKQLPNIIHQFIEQYTIQEISENFSIVHTELQQAIRGIIHQSQ